MIQDSLEHTHSIPAALRALMEEKVAQYNRASFIASDPLYVPHQFSLKNDREIAAFLTATIAWGNRKSILKNALHLMELMDNSPYDFVMGFSEKDLDPFRRFVHRTFNHIDAGVFLFSLKNIYQHYGGMEQVFVDGAERPLMDTSIALTKSEASDHGLVAEKHPAGSRIKAAIMGFRDVFFNIPHPKRTQKHVSDPGRGSAAKRLNMMLRWFIRKDDSGVDLGIWNSFSPAELMCPLDLHSGRVARKLGLLQRKQNDWQAVEELTAKLREMDPSDPVKFDFALFGMGVFEKVC